MLSFHQLLICCGLIFRDLICFVNTLTKYPEYFISPQNYRLCLFSQYKCSAGGKLDAANYSYSQAVSLVKQVTTTHHSGKDYRDGELAVPSLLLSKKQYKKCDIAGEN